MIQEPVSIFGGVKDLAQRYPLRAIFLFNLVIPLFFVVIYYFAFHFEPQIIQGIKFSRLPSSIGYLFRLYDGFSLYLVLLVINLGLYHCLKNFRKLILVLLVLNLLGTGLTMRGSFITSLYGFPTSPIGSMILQRVSG